MGHKKKTSAEAFAKPATGQAVPGALSGANTQTQSGGSSVAFPSRTESPFRQVDGKTQTLVNAPVTDLSQQTPGFAAKLAGAQAAEAQQTQTFDTGSQLFNGSNANLQQQQQGVNQQQGLFGQAKDFVSEQTQDILNKLNDKNLQSRVVLGGLLTPLLGELAFVRGTTKVAQLAKTGSTGLNIISQSTAETFAINGATQTITASWLAKLASHLKKPATVVGAIMGAIGSYPFAGFIKEEALQTVSFATTTAAKNNDVEGMRAALDLNKEILEPTVWKQIINKVPFANVVSNLEDFYEAAKLNQVVNEQVYSDLKVQIETGEPEDKKWERVKQQEVGQNKSVVDYYNSERKKLLQWELQAKQSNNREAAAYWAEQRRLQAKFEEEQRKSVAEFWLAYKRQVQKLNDENRPSKLGFGLIR